MVPIALPFKPQPFFALVQYPFRHVAQNARAGEWNVNLRRRGRRSSHSFGDEVRVLTSSARTSAPVIFRHISR